MIKSKADYIRFLKTELGRHKSYNFFYLYIKLYYYPCKRFLLLLRTSEYLLNTKKGPLSKPFYYLVKYLKFKLGTRLSFSIPENVVDEGLQLPHYGTIVINGKARLGKFCRIHVCVNIGASGGDLSAPKLGDYIYIGPGAKIYGSIEIASRVAIAANAAVSKSCLESDVVLGGVPAKIIGKVDIATLITKKAHSDN